MEKLIRRIGYKHIRELTKLDLESKFRATNCISAIEFYSAIGALIFKKNTELALYITGAFIPTSYVKKIYERELRTRDFSV